MKRWVGHGLLSKKTVRPHERSQRPPAPVAEGIEFRQGCRFLCVGALGKLLGGRGRSLPGSVGRFFLMVFKAPLLHHAV